MKLQLALLMALFALVTMAQAVSVLSRLSAAQGSDGSFALTADSPASVEATSHALFLRALYGLEDEFGSADAFLRSVENADGGFGRLRGAPSDAEATRDATRARQYAGADQSELQAAAKFMQAQWRPDAGLFAAVAQGPAGSVAATAAAVEVLAAAGALNTAATQTKALKAWLPTQVGDYGFSFDGAAAELSQGEAAEYGLSIARAVGWEPEHMSAWHQVLAMRVQESQFGSWGDLVELGHLVAALDHIQAMEERPGPLLQEEECAAALQFAFSVTGYTDNLRYAALAHRIVASLRRDNGAFLGTDINYSLRDQAQPRNGETHFLQGSAIRPVMRVENIDAQAHQTLDVSCDVTLPSGAVETVALEYQDDFQGYAAAGYVETAMELGDVLFKFTVSYTVPSMGEISYELTDARALGYRVSVSDQATFDGEEMGRKDLVRPGTEFDFTVTVGNLESPSFVEGPFTMRFAVLDAAGVVVHEAAYDGESAAAASGDDAITFAYTHEALDVPAGPLVFRFEVEDMVGNVHSRNAVSYEVAATMVAAHVEATAEASLGSTVALSMRPGAVHDGELHLFKANPERTFFADVRAANGAKLTTLPGVSQANGAYAFSLDVPATLDFIGENSVVFFFQMQSGERVDLAPRAGAEEDLGAVTFTVSADLSVADVQRDQATDVNYGDVVSVSFKVLSGKTALTSPGDGDHSAFVLALAYPGDDDSTMVASAAESDAEGRFSLEWTVNANSRAGAARVLIEARNSAGETLSLGGAPEWDVTIGGDIAVEAFTFSTSDADQFESVFVVNFGLTCGGNELEEASLSAAVTRGSEVVFSSLPVAQGQHGGYQVSWTQLTQDVEHGTYTLAFAGADGPSPLDVAPMFTIALDHKSDSLLSTVAVRYEHVLVYGLAAIVAWLGFFA